MSETFNVYCDESGHLENDQQAYMVMGAVWCPIGKIKEIGARITDIKVQHGLSPSLEIKWTKISPRQEKFYLALIDYFYDCKDLHLRALVADKRNLRHGEFAQTHDDWYYKMYFTMLKVLIDPKSIYHIYLDIKDTKSSKKERKLHEFLCQTVQDYDQKVIVKLQSIRSHESFIMQLTDLLIGAIAYANRGEFNSAAKTNCVNLLIKRSGCRLTRSTWPANSKTNIFVWSGKEGK